MDAREISERTQRKLTTNTGTQYQHVLDILMLFVDDLGKRSAVDLQQSVSGSLH